METTLFDRTGQPVAYVADDAGRTVYLWSGQAVAYLDHDVLVGWNGRQLGIYMRGRVYDVTGRLVGSIADECTYVPLPEPAKPEKLPKRMKHPRDSRLSSPKLSLAWSATELQDLLGDGAVPEL
jgi:hypothetical protein